MAEKYENNKLLYKFLFFYDKKAIMKNKRFKDHK
jgi:hypothetical protein